MSTGLSLGQLAGPAIGAVMLFTVGPAIGMFVNAAIYLPFAIYLLVLPLDGHRRRANAGPRLKFREVFGVLRELPRYPSILVVLLLQGAVGVLIGTAIMPLLPEFGDLLGLDAAGFGYGLLLIATSAGAVVGGLSLEAIGRIRASTRLAIVSTLVFALCTLVFAFSRSFVLTLIVLAISGVATIVSSSTSQTVVQLQAPDDRRGRFLGAYGMTSMGLRLGSGVLLGLLGGVVGIPAAVAIDSIALAAVAVALLIIVLAWLRRRRDIDPDAIVELDETGPVPVTE
jgi:MFS family permease